MARLSTRLVVNAGTTYLRLGTTFLLGIFLTWYLVGRVGLEVFGMISLAMGTFGLSRAIEGAVNGSLNREFAASIASGDALRVRRTFNCAFVVSAIGAAIIFVFSASMGGLALAGVFRVPEGIPGMRPALAALFVGEGAYIAVRMVLSPYRQALFGDRRVGLDNLLQVVARVAHTISPVIVFSWLLTDAPLETALYAYAAVHAVLMLADAGVSIVLAKRLVPGLVIDPRAVGRTELREMRDACWRTAQHLVLMDFSPQFIGILINLFFGVAYNGIWQIAVQVFGHARLLAEGILQGLDPIATHLQEAKREHTIRDLLVRSVRYQLAVALPWIVTYVVFMQPILWLWVGDRLARNEELRHAGLSVQQAIDAINAIAVGCLVAMVCRVVTKGVERVLYGLGHVASYSWFAKYALAIVVVLCIALFAGTGRVETAFVPMLVANFLYYDVIVLRAARRTIDFDGVDAIRRSSVRPLAAAALLGLGLIPLRLAFGELSLVTLGVVAAAAGAIYLPLCVGIVMVPDERRRAAEMARRLLHRARPA